jgi:hypothetical protein
VYVFDHVDVCVVEIFAGNFVGVSVVIAAHLDEYQVGGLFGVDVPFFGLVAVEGVGAAAGVGCLVPVPCLCN